MGKIAVPDAVLHKADELSNEEWEVMRRHPQVGCKIVSQVELLASAGDIILAHHERFDGSGYPRGLAGEEIPLGARIFSVADAYDAMTSNRPYREAKPVRDAIDEIRSCSGTQFDPRVVDAFLKVSANTDGNKRRVEPTPLDHSPLPAPAD